MFLGTHTPRLDEKGRLFLPAKYREELAGGLVITKGQERCLYVFPVAEFGRITEALRSAPVTAKAVRDYSRVFFASASDEIPDKQGRITIPPGLRDYAALTRDCAVIGANTRLEIWDSAAWESYLAEQEDAFSDSLRGGAARDAVSGAGIPVPRARRGLHPRLGDHVGWRHFPGARRRPGSRGSADGDLAGQHTSPPARGRQHGAGEHGQARRPPHPQEAAAG